MSYLRKIEYKIVPEDSYKVIRKCPCCGVKSLYCSTNNFRVNANGNKIDVWLIYQCEKCKHTLNLTIYERHRPESISQWEYNGFMANDKELAKQYGMDKKLFTGNRAEIALKEMKYKLIDVENSQDIVKNEIRLKAGDLIELDNPCELKLRIDKVVADLLHITRSKEKKLEQDGLIKVESANQNKKIRIWIKEDIRNELIGAIVSLQLMKINAYDTNCALG